MPKIVVARYDDERHFWLCEDAEFYGVLRGLTLPEDYYPDEPLALVNYAASLYHGKVMDLRDKKDHTLKPGEVF
jgi:hypothetical protein